MTPSEKGVEEQKIVKKRDKFLQNQDLAHKLSQKHLFLFLTVSLNLI